MRVVVMESAVFTLPPVLVNFSTDPYLTKEGDAYGFFREFGASRTSLFCSCSIEFPFLNSGRPGPRRA